MSSGLASDEVAEDYKNSLEDLTNNDRFQISNLTVIAKENTEHAMAISRVLENHIRTTPPAQKLPALYVVDSIVKNVGTPYTLFLGRNLYQTFMNAYTLVDSQTRKKLDEMLKTWKEPVPGSLDTRPVFPPEITRSIESALIKARTAALQQQQARTQQDILARGRVGTPPAWNSTPTPPQGMGRHPPAANQALPMHYQRNGSGHGYPPSQGESYSSRGTPTPQAQPRSTEVDLAVLNRDIEALIATARNDFANNPLDPSIQQRLKALLDLQGILQRQELTQEQLKLVRDQVSALAPKPAMPAPQAMAPSVPAVSTPPMATPPAQTLSQPLQQLLNPGTLAGLLKATATRQQPTPPPQIHNILPQMPTNTTAPQPSVSAAPENPLIAALRAQGLLPPASAPPAPFTAAPPPNVTPAFPLIVPGQVRVTPPVATPQTQQGTSNAQINVQMSTASIKIPRQMLISSLYETRSNRCGTCGQRFFATEEGKEKKARHLDWHFRTNQRMSEAARRAQNRSWYVDERDWIKSREAGDEQDLAETEASAEGVAGADGAATKKGPPKQWIHAPNDATLRNTPCPICQEKFESTWSEDVQDWIWQDAVKVGSRVYHASCYAEVTNNGPTPASRGTPSGRTGTPESVLGKRKAEGTDSPGSNVRIKTEPV
ncbi:putative mRNA cleavage factor complex component Pcf11 [Aspergillus niger CBS 101883]|uniref:mRNA cleavage factor complex component Pcf11 n=2 Tax=Aspergillus TaxID=5052 RepID=A0A370PS24_ASPPH|nr:mRNA cleavage factor complex component Pcf11 [Aspergillus niger CBS 513.88]XP_025458694.1 mRNA cleavage factor complex component Pcf11 [Aspergillus niger CBS 101883]PYH60639.1 mRNA cleavage factor complex component Pcf11 [Aspergillus niger CBS 101883]RDH15276.1 mRNA cleavage factor complex component Pcf11 [Aspergillus niger ATCC 13496]RDK44997.1 mRNA cleavage factor complex component Pcf11 [Aspergillus phoenicis ATCC 13157]|eukprot:XP_001392083.2 mRNA cleavage factor complex component Pcf11 [Aspergillus niger CBS 513.88]